MSPDSAGRSSSDPKDKNATDALEIANDTLLGDDSYESISSIESSYSITGAPQLSDFETDCGVIVTLCPPWVVRSRDWDSRGSSSSGLKDHRPLLEAQHVEDTELKSELPSTECALGAETQEVRSKLSAQHIELSHEVFDRHGGGHVPERNHHRATSDVWWRKWGHAQVHQRGLA